ncbi:MAG: AAA family ATPase, partial [Actinocrinis sp.]
AGDQRAGRGPHRMFTDDQAMEFCRPHIEALRAALDGQINARLNDAAKVISHFIPAFWSDTQAREFLYEALSHTVYDGRTWKADATIDSAFHSAAGDWVAEKVDPRSGPSTAGAHGEAGHGEAPSGPSRLGQILKRSELATLPAVTPLVEGVMSYPASVLMVGATGVGKTFVALSLACSVATGHNWLDRKVTRRRVLFVVGEGAYGMDKRVRAWEQAWNDGAPVPDDHMTVIVKPGSLKDAPTWAELAGYASSGGYGLVVLDTFSSLAPDADETKDAAQIMRRLSDLSATIDGCAVLVHHPGWSDSGRARGGYQLEANADEVLILRAVAEGSDQFTMSRKKVKDGPDGEVHWLRRSPSHGSQIIEGSRSDDASMPLRARILAVLTGCGEAGATGPQVMAEIGVDPKARSAFYSALRKLINEGAAAESGDGTAKRYYALTW